MLCYQFLIIFDNCFCQPYFCRLKTRILDKFDREQRILSFITTLQNMYMQWLVVIRIKLKCKT